MPAAPPEPGFGHGRRRSPRCRPGWATALGSTGYPRKLSQWDGANICSHTYIHMHMKDIYIYIPNNPPAVIGVGGGVHPRIGAAVTQSQRPWARENPRSWIYSGQTVVATQTGAGFQLVRSVTPRWRSPNGPGPGKIQIPGFIQAKPANPHCHGPIFEGPPESRISVKIPRPSDRPFPGAGACPPRTAATGAERC